MNSVLTSRTDPAQAALLVVDVLNDFCHPDGVYGLNGVDVSAATTMVPRLQRLIAAARRSGTLVVFIGTTHSDRSDTTAWVRRREGRPADAVALGVPCAPGSWGAEFFEVAPAAGEPVLTKHRYSAFVGTELDALLRERGISSVLCTGVVTEACVESTARDALFHDYHVTVVEDCCASYRPDAHRASMSTLAEYFGPVVTSVDVIDSWGDAASPKASTPVGPGGE